MPSFLTAQAHHHVDDVTALDQGHYEADVRKQLLWYVQRFEEVYVRTHAKYVAFGVVGMVSYCASIVQCCGQWCSHIDVLTCDSLMEKAHPGLLHQFRTLNLDPSRDMTQQDQDRLATVLV